MMLIQSLFSWFTKHHHSYPTFSPQVVTQFKSSLVGLTEILMSKEPWYVRCIKPNEAKQPGEALCPETPLLNLKALPKLILLTVCSACSQLCKLDHAVLTLNSLHDLWCPLQGALTTCWWDIRWSTWGWWSTWGSGVLGLLTDANTTSFSRGRDIEMLLFLLENIWQVHIYAFVSLVGIN